MIIYFYINNHILNEYLILKDREFQCFSKVINILILSSSVQKILIHINTSYKMVEEGLG